MLLVSPFFHDFTKLILIFGQHYDSCVRIENTRVKNYVLALNVVVLYKKTVN